MRRGEGRVDKGVGGGGVVHRDSHLFWERAARVEHPPLRSGKAKHWELGDPLPTAPSFPQMSVSRTRGMPVTQKSPQRQEAL